MGGKNISKAKVASAKTAATKIAPKIAVASEKIAEKSSAKKIAPSKTAVALAKTESSLAKSSPSLKSGALSKMQTSKKSETKSTLSKISAASETKNFAAKSSNASKSTSAVSAKKNSAAKSQSEKLPTKNVATSSKNVTTSEKLPPSASAEKSQSASKSSNASKSSDKSKSQSETKNENKIASNSALDSKSSGENKSDKNQVKDEQFSAWAGAKTIKKTKKQVALEKKAEKSAAESLKKSSEKLLAAKKIDPNAKIPQKKLKDYDDEQIKHLDALEHIRLRSGMYIGRLGNGSNENDGIYILLKEIIDNAIDEFIVGFGKKIDCEIKENRVKVRDYGRGIPLGKVVDCVSEINTGAKYNDDVFQFSVGMNGVGTKAVNALSSYFRVISIREGHCTEAIFEKGKLQKQRTGPLKQKMSNGTFFEFVPDEEIFGKYSFNMEFVEKRIWNYAYLNSGLTIRLNGTEIKSDAGLLDLLNKELGAENSSKSALALYPIGNYTGEHLKFAFTHTNSYGENYFSFVNGQYTSDGGTHLAAFKEGFIKGVRDFFGSNYAPEDIREGITAAVLVKIKDPIFESQTKNKLGNTDIRAWIATETQSALDNYLHKNPDVAKKLQEKIRANEKLRTELSAVKKEAKEAAKKVSIRIPKLKDCKYHIQDGEKGENSMIFITEGDSASGTMTHSRDANFQAIFSLRGKPENMFGKKQSEIYKNDELYQLMMALGIEQSVENLKYSKIVIATDADNDGFHIRNLVMTFFLGYFEELVTSGRVFILETPLFRVRNKKENVYCYTESERDAAQKKLGSSSETTRFKGLGEINPSEFRQFIDPLTMHLTPIEVQALKNVPPLLAFYMGKNTPERRTFIEKHLLQNIDA